MTDTKSTERLVWEALDQLALDGFEDWIRENRAEDIADDLRNSASSELAGCSRRALLPHVKSWRFGVTINRKSP